MASDYSPTGDTGAHDAARLNSDYWLQHRDKLFVASCIALIVTAMSFAIRGALIEPLGTQFGLTKEQIGTILSTAFWGFTLSIIIGGPLCDVLGMGRLMILAFVGHLVGIVMTIMARDYNALFISTLFFGMANGFVEAACNPLIATLYPDQKIKRLNMFHMWFPGGIVIGGLTAYAIGQLNLGGEARVWQLQMASMLLPLAIYGVMFLGKKSPQTERVASHVSTSEMFRACLNPFFLLFVACMVLTAATELVTGQWMPDVLTVTTGTASGGILFLCLQNGLMAIGRSRAGEVVHRVSPVAILLASSIISSIGLYLLARVTDVSSAAIGTVVFAAGVCFFWPTMLGVVSERFPKTGSLGLAIMGGIGMLSVSIVLKVIGHIYDSATATAYGGVGKLKAAQSQLGGLQDQVTLLSQQVLDGNAAAPAKLKAVQTQIGAIKADITPAQAKGALEALQSLFYLPIILTVIFAAIYLYDRARGGYREEVLVQSGQNAA